MREKIMTDDEFIDIAGDYEHRSTACGVSVDSFDWVGFGREIERRTLERVLKLSDTHVTNARLLDASRALMEPKK